MVEVLFTEVLPFVPLPLCAHLFFVVDPFLSSPILASSRVKHTNRDHRAERKKLSRTSVHKTAVSVVLCVSDIFGRARQAIGCLGTRPFWSRLPRSRPHSAGRAKGGGATARRIVRRFRGVAWPCATCTDSVGRWNILRLSDEVLLSASALDPAKIHTCAISSRCCLYGMLGL
jgi:hypothetical protein